MADLVDGHGRRVTYVRISVTDRCNLRCVYCMPEDQKFRPLPHLMTREEIARSARLLASFGIEKIRLTGGEPTTRPDLPGVVVTDLHSRPDPGVDDERVPLQEARRGLDPGPVCGGTTDARATPETSSGRTPLWPSSPSSSRPYSSEVRSGWVATRQW